MNEVMDAATYVVVLFSVVAQSGTIGGLACRWPSRAGDR